MNEKAIKKLRRKFILTALISFVAVMVLMCTTIYFVNYGSSNTKIKKSLDFIADNHSMFQNDFRGTSDEAISKKPRPDVRDKNSGSSFTDFFENMFNTGVDDSSEFVYSIRFFTVSFSPDGKSGKIGTNRIAMIDEEKAVDYAGRALESGKEYGELDGFSYKVKKDSGETLVVCMDIGSQIADVNRVGYIAFMITLIGSVFAYVFIRIISKKMIQPEIRAAERQKQFITNASHELKTPLAVIRANTELEMMMHGEDEWNQSTMNQVDRMTGLIADLVTIAKAEESDSPEEISEVDVTALAEKTADTFSSVAAQSGKTLEKELDEGVKMTANEAKIGQLMTLLVDNAIKYCDDGGTVKIKVSQKGKGIKLSVTNNYAEGEKQDYSKFFERFYRDDQSHNIDKGGYGIGLSIADGVVKTYRGKIDVSWKDGVIDFTCNLKG